MIYSVDGHEPSILPENKKFRLAWHDEFDGTELDRTKWDFRTSMMGKKWYWTDKAVHLDGAGNCVFTLVEENGQPVSSQLQTGYNFMDEPVIRTKFGNDDLQWNIGKLKENKFTHKYGYYECRCRLQQKEGWWSAFWMQSPNIGSTLDPADSGAEIDIMESFHPGEMVPNNIFACGYGQDMKCLQTGGTRKLDKTEFHRFGVLWDENGYAFYIDGEEQGKINGLVSGRPLFILISTEVYGYRTDAHKAVKEAYDSIGDTFVVDYVRVFDAE